jgi:DUF4097 and DUF4098 domain-containing protein YvlB
MRTSIRNAGTMFLLAALAAPGCVAISGSDFKYLEREEKRFTTAGKPQVTLSTFDGPIEIHPWDRPEVLVVVEKRGLNKDDIAPIVVRAEQDGDRVSLDVTGSRERGGSFFGVNMRSAKLIVSLPAASDVNAKSGDGSITIERVSGNVTAHTGDGSIRLYDVGGALNLDTGDGSIHVAGKLTALRARTGDGSVTVDAERGSSAAADWDITTGDGSVTVGLPDGFNAELDAHTGDGRIHLNDVAVGDTSASDDGARRSRRTNTVRGRLGSGGKSVRIRTGDGSITLRRS